MIAERGFAFFAIGMLVLCGFCGRLCLANSFRIGRRAAGMVLAQFYVGRKFENIMNHCPRGPDHL